MATSINNHPKPTPMALLSVEEFHTLNEGRIGKNTLYRMVREGRIRSIKLGERKILIPASELNDWPARELGVIA